MYYYLTMGKVPVQMPTNGDYYLPGNFPGENKRNVLWILIYPRLHRRPVDNHQE